MNRIIMRFAYIIISFLALFVLSSCQTQDYYRARAVEKARDYAIPRLRDLQESQLDHIRYAPPKLMESEIFTRNQTQDKTPSKNDIYQTCIVWDDVPGLDYSIVVFGVSERRMDDWTAERVIRKTFRTEDAARDAAILLSVEYAMNNMLYLSDEMRNRIRFSPPQDFRTRFEIDPDKYKTKKKLTRREKDLDAYTKSQQKQFSFVWNTDKEDEKIVITGLCLEKFAGWIPITGLVRSKAELDENTLKPEELEKEKAGEMAKTAKKAGTATESTAKTETPEVTEITETALPPVTTDKSYNAAPSSDTGSGGFKQLNKFQR